MTTNLYLALALVAGMALPIQVGINAMAARHLEQPLHASALSFVVGSVALLLYSFFMNPPSMVRFGSLQPLLWTGGLLGAFYVMATVITGPKLGAALAFSCIVAGQFVVSLILDHFGWVGFNPHPVSFGRIVGITLVIVGVIIVRRF